MQSRWERDCCSGRAWQRPDEVAAMLYFSSLQLLRFSAGHPLHNGSECICPRAGAPVDG